MSGQYKVAGCAKPSWSRGAAITTGESAGADLVVFHLVTRYSASDLPSMI